MTLDFRVWRPNVPLIQGEIPPMEIGMAQAAAKIVDEYLYRMTAK